MNAIIKKLFQNGADIKLKLAEDGETPVYVLNGFYKYGEVNITASEDGTIHCKTRYDIQKNIANWEDMVMWNYQVWDGYKNNFSGWNTPEPEFLPSMIEMGLVTQTTTTTISYN